MVDCKRMFEIIFAVMIINLPLVESSVVVNLNTVLALNTYSLYYSKEDVAKQKWLLWCNANAVCYESMMAPLASNLGDPLEYVARR